MKSYVWVTFAFMGWGYYEMSGGSDFEPQVPVVAEVEVAPLDEPVAVTRDTTPTLLAVSTSNIAPEPAVAEAEVVIEATPVAVVEPVAEPEVVETAVIEPEVALDIRQVAGNRVNMRIGPGTNFDVITTLDGGTEIEVLSVNADGWANISVLDSGYEGWMAERLLTDPQT